MKVPSLVRPSQAACALCGRSIVGPFLQDQYGTTVCACHEPVVLCSYCGRIPTKSTGGGTDLGDGRRLCGPCRDVAVLAPPQASLGLQSVETTLARVGLRLSMPVRVRLVTYAVLRRDMGSESRDCQGYTRTSVFVDPTHQVEREVVDIAMLVGLPEPEFERTLAHEVGHAWMALKGFPHDLAPWLEEGVAESIAFLFLEEQHTESARAMQSRMRNRQDSVYGDGFRLVWAAMQRKGVVPTLRHVKVKGALPG